MPHQVTAELSTRKREDYAREKKKGTCYLNKKTHSVDVSGSRCVRARKTGRGEGCMCDARRPEKPEACLKTTHAKAGEEKPAC